ncbi:single-stranded DNA-binding protein [Rothia sp. ZJ1223]|uniref:single-stranded DNA-binding protein n=1 Tax=Rothia sp. ZJ1223 TaxID=2811098 RepID=UPI00195633C9|nr:single-stranded DNA-binding protein [Rothia sp. ZJ1223]MBM7051824.1 single-stranded DNA-binding protein [Rothia sp. ZJ1223]
MAGDTVITVIGNLTGDPELRFTPNGAAVANFTIASTPRVFDRQSGEWKEGETLFLRASAWRDAAENIAETLKKGMRVIAQGRLKSRSYETKEGERRTSMELEIEEIGPSLRFATASVNRNQRNGGNNYGGAANGGFNGGGQGGYNAGGQNGGFGGQQGGYNNAPVAPAANQFNAGSGNGYNNGGNTGGGFNAVPAAPAADPWGAQSGGNYDWGGGADDEPPF